MERLAVALPDLIAMGADASHVPSRVGMLFIDSYGVSQVRPRIAAAKPTMTKTTTKTGK